MHTTITLCIPRSLSFLDWLRRYRKEPDRLRRRQDKCTLALGVRFVYELMDLFIGQYAGMFLPHYEQGCFEATGDDIMEYTSFFVGTMTYLQELRWGGTVDGTITVRYRSGHLSVCAFPAPLPLGDPIHGRIEGDRVFGMNSADTVYSQTAFAYLLSILEAEVASLTQCAARRITFTYRIRAVAALYHYIEDAPTLRPLKLREWNYVNRVALERRDWSAEQTRVLDAMRIGTSVDDTSDSNGDRFLFISGEPGSGKSEVLVHGAVAATESGCNTLILCPTGALVHGYRARLPESDLITVETIHSAFCIHREQDAVVRYSPPTRLRRYELIILDEASQVDNSIAQRLFMAIQELPQRPFVCVAADFAQLAPVSGGSMMQSICEAMKTIVLRTVYRTKDPSLLLFLSNCRVAQPPKAMLQAFFKGRVLGPSLAKAVRAGIEYGRAHGVLFSWLCVTNAGAERVNEAALALLGIDDKDEAHMYGDPKVGAGRINVTVGVMLRLTRNLDKGRGFVNGAVGEVYAKLGFGAFILRLSSGTLVLVHPICVAGRHVLPCAYGYATTIRKSQGASLEAGCLFFDHCYPAERGYGYVGASRFRTKCGLFYYGTVRRSDWLPRATAEDQQVHRSYDSQSEDSEEAERDAEYDSSEEEDSMDGELGRLCRASDAADPICAASDTDDEPGELHAASMAMPSATRSLADLDGMSGLARLL